MPRPNKRFTPAKSLVATRQRWLNVNEWDPKLNEIGRRLVRAAKDSQERFDQVARELVPETSDG